MIHHEDVAPTETAASYARSVVLSSSHVAVGVFGMQHTLTHHLVTTQGCVVSPISDMAGECADYVEVGHRSPTIDLWAWDIAASAQPDRLRGSVHLKGTVVPVRADTLDGLGWGKDVPIAAFVPESIIVTRHDPAVQDDRQVTIQPATYRAASHDVLAGWEGEWIHHLSRHHAAELTVLSSRHPSWQEGATVHPLRAHAFGLELRVYHQSRIWDIGVEFPHPVICGCEAVDAWNALMEECGAGCEHRCSDASQAAEAGDLHADPSAPSTSRKPAS